jgi:signal transduction histidine kinase
MTGSYAYTPHIWPSLLTVVLLAALAAYSWRRRAVPGALVFAVSCLVIVPWAAGSAMEAAAVDDATKIFWWKFQSAWLLPSATAITCFVLEYARPGRWLTRRNLALLSIVPLVSLGLLLTNDAHHLLYRGFVVGETVIPLRATVDWLIIVYGYALALLEAVALAWLFIRSPQHRWPVVIMLAGLAVGRLLWLLEAARLFPPGLPLQVPPVGFEYAMYAVALFAFRIFDPIPLARQRAVEQLRAGMVVLDPRGRVASLNPAAERILAVPVGRARGRPIEELLPACPAEPLAGPAETEVEFSLPEGARDDAGAGHELRHYTLAISVLRDWRGLEAGRLLLLHDVTAQKRSQAQIVEQQRALAMLHERERLARELHDSIGQVLGYAAFQIETARELMGDGQAAAADEQLARLAGVVREAHADVREYILNLRVAPSAQVPFSAALQRYLDAFGQNYGIPAELAAGEGWDDAALEPDARLALFRIIQEALSNARRHGAARCVRVTLGTGDAWARVTIQDDGRGFDPGQAAVGSAAGRFGLQFMRERAEQLGGTLRVASAPGAGASVVVEVPVETRGHGDAETR